jgi:hypothetical protein
MRAVASKSAFTVWRERLCGACFLKSGRDLAAHTRRPKCEYATRAIARNLFGIESIDKALRAQHPIKS